ncbi:MAG: SDR family oxidoreductase [Desulfatiglans sp.]|nr:SDR family oxidoreductase [Thermodesulfobacteriota bacterium]MEE4353906.1 SDR family oxidoreductase [Desulfatiglans sp.]
MKRTGEYEGRHTPLTRVLITGGNRGLGLEWVKQYAESGWKVFATCRHPSEAADLRDLAVLHKNITIHRMDVTKPDEINAIAVELQDESIDVLLNNAGVYLEKYMDIRLGCLRYEDWMHTFEVNTLGAMRLAEAFHDHIAKSRKRLIAVISTHMGSIADIVDGGDYYYRSSKTALNAAMKGLSCELKSEGIGVLLLHPGWVKTRMGGQDTSLLPPQSVRGMRRLIEDFTMEMTGCFYRYDGVEMPW